MRKHYSRRSALVGAVASATALTFSRTKVNAAEPVTHDVQIKQFAFEPANLEVHVGDTIRWTNKDLAPHTATANEFGWDTGELVNGASAEIVITETMETSYFCAFHPHMTGKLTITTR